MAVTSKLAKYLGKKVKEAPPKRAKNDPRMDKEEVKETARSVEMTKLSNAELKAIAEKAKNKYSSGKKYTRSDAALDEIERRSLKRSLKKEGKLKDDKENPVYDVDTGARLSDAYSASDLRKEIERRSKQAKDQGFKAGGMVKKYRIGGFSGRASGAAKQAQGQMQAAKQQVGAVQKTPQQIMQAQKAAQQQLRQAQLQAKSQKQATVTSRKFGDNEEYRPSGLSATEKANQQKEMEQARNSSVANKMGRSLGAYKGALVTKKAAKKPTVKKVTAKKK